MGLYYLETRPGKTDAVVTKLFRSDRARCWTVDVEKYFLVDFGSHFFDNDADIYCCGSYFWVV